MEDFMENIKDIEGRMQKSVDNLKEELWNTYTNPAGCQCFCTRSKNDSDSALGSKPY